ncbi:transposase [Flexibacterium corallicola]|uniref:transposase n=1 Tax=Flexibacterium corallicola TaxID=3037259 RepID=UPI00286F6466|nr:transposase [Pseudovibrio sp. M1P-2-3]
MLGVVEEAKKGKAGWSSFLRHLIDRGLFGVQLILSDACLGLIESTDEKLPDACWQRRMVHFYRSVFYTYPPPKFGK